MPISAMYAPPAAGGTEAGTMLIVFTLMAIFGWGWRIFGLPMGWVGIIGMAAYLIMWNLNRAQAQREQEEAQEAFRSYREEAMREIRQFNEGQERREPDET